MRAIAGSTQVVHRPLLRLRWRAALEPAHGSKATPDAPHVPLQPSHTAAPTQRPRTREHGAAQHGPPQPSDWAAPDLKRNWLRLRWQTRMHALDGLEDVLTFFGELSIGHPVTTVTLVSR